MIVRATKRRIVNPLSPKAASPKFVWLRSDPPQLNDDWIVWMPWPRITFKWCFVPRVLMNPWKWHHPPSPGKLAHLWRQSLLMRDFRKVGSAASSTPPIRLDHDAVWEAASMHQKRKTKGRTTKTTLCLPDFDDFAL